LKWRNLNVIVCFDSYAFFLFISQVDDVKRFEKDRLLTVHMYMLRRKAGATGARCWNDNIDSIRGLEDLLDSERKQKLVTSHRLSVIQEQERIRAQNSKCPDSIANPEAVLAQAAKRTSKESRQEAQIRGSKDALFGYRKPSRLLTKLRSLME